MKPLADRILIFIIFVADIMELLARAAKDCLLTLRQGYRPVLTVYLRQLYFTGLQALQIILVTSLIIGTVVISQMVSIAGVGGQYLTGKVMVWIVVRELAPLITAIVVIARSGTAIATELSQMKIGGELDFLEGMGIPISHYLVMPRVLGVSSAVVLLTVYFAVGALAGGFVVASLGWHVPLEQYSQGLFSVLKVREVVGALCKSFLFGLAIAAICCRQGLKVGRSVTYVPQAATKAVMQSMLVVFVLDGATALLYLLHD